VAIARSRPGTIGTGRDAHRSGPAGELRALAVTTAARSEALPELPSVGDFVPGYESSQWYGIGVPKHTPAEIVAKLNQEINAAARPR
jgi:tripartite-type tricarboxylate transporter receptor subunit TctC